MNGSNRDNGRVPEEGAAVYSYEIDAADRIVNCNQGWDDFAIANEGHGLVSANICGTSIWDHVADPVTVGLYKRIFKSAREGKPVQFFMRCDSPTVRRLLHISVSPTIEGLVKTTSLVFREDRRTKSVEMIHCNDKGDIEGCIPMCTWCNKIDVGGWYEPEDAVERLEETGGEIPPRVFHATCDACRQRIEHQLGAVGHREFGEPSSI